MRLIDADALMKYCQNQKNKTISCNDIARFPTAVGQCKDCNAAKRYPDYELIYCSYHSRVMTLDDFCNRFGGVDEQIPKAEYRGDENDR